MNNTELKKWLPRGYFSVSQYTLYKKSPKQWKKIYLEGEKQFVTKAMEAGKEFEKFLTLTGEFEGYEEQVEIKTDMGTVPFLGYADFYKDGHLVEVKTGKLWDQKRVNESPQLIAYYVGLKQIGKSVDKITLTYAKGEDGEIDHDNLKHINRNLPKDPVIDSFIKDFTKVAIQAAEDAKAYAETDTTDDIDLELALSNYVKAEAALKDAKQVVLDLFDKKGVDKYQGSIGSVYTSERKTWQYSDKFKQAKKDLEELDKVQGEATLKTTTSVTIRCQKK